MGIVLIIVIVMIVFVVMRVKSRKITCPNCGFTGQGKPDGASGCLTIILLMIGIIPGILYLLFCGKSGIICPKCGMRIR